jgi:hypothetical protein
MNETQIDLDYPQKVKDAIAGIFFEIGLNEFGYIDSEEEMIQSAEYDVFWTVESLPDSPAIVYMKLCGKGFLLGIWGDDWRIVFNGDKYLNFTEIEYLKKSEINIPMNVIELLVQLVDTFKRSLYYLGLSDYRKIHVAFYKHIEKPFCYLHTWYELSDSFIRDSIKWDVALVIWDDLTNWKPAIAFDSGNLHFCFGNMWGINQLVIAIAKKNDIDKYTYSFFELIDINSINNDFSISIEIQNFISEILEKDLSLKNSVRNLFDT